MAHRALARIHHRPWPLPQRGWSWSQSWLDLAFLHWRLPADRLRPLLPAGLELETFDGTAWIGVVPFRMRIRPRFVPPVPRLGFFPEINVRTYVRAGDKPGVWFLSLDARNPLAVWAARRFFHLPYHRARMKAGLEPDGVRYASRRVHGEAVFHARYRPTSAVYEAAPGTLDHFLTERYCLYASGPRGLLRIDVHHAPWPLQKAELELESSSMLEPLGLESPRDPPLLHFARRIDVALWSPRPVASSSAASSATGP